MSTAYFYGIATQALAAGQIDWDAHTFKVLLVGPGYVFNQDVHAAIGDITNEVAASGYTAGGWTVTGKTNVRTANLSVLDSNDPIWTSPDLANVAGLVLYDQTSGILVLYVDFEGAFGQVAGTFTYPVDAGGWAVVGAGDAVGRP